MIAQQVLLTSIISTTSPQICILFKINFICVGILPAISLHIMCVPGSHGAQKRVPNPLELELQIVCALGAGN